MTEQVNRRRPFYIRLQPDSKVYKPNDDFGVIDLL